MMRGHLGEAGRRTRIDRRRDRRKVLPEGKLRTRDLKGSADTVTCGKAVAAAFGLSRHGVIAGVMPR